MIAPLFSFDRSWAGREFLAAAGERPVPAEGCSSPLFSLPLEVARAGIGYLRNEPRIGTPLEV